MRYLLLFLLFVCASARAELTMTTYACPTWPCTQSGTPLSTATTSGTINYNWGGGVVLNSGMSDFVSIKATGYITIPGAPGQTVLVYFASNNDDGSQIIVDNTMIVNDWSGMHPAQFYQGAINLVAGQTYPITIWFSEWGGGAVWQTYWSVQGGPGNAQSWVLLDTATYTATSYTLPPAYSSNITTIQQGRVNTFTNKTITNNGVYIDQVGDNNTVNVTQVGSNNILTGVGQQAASIQGNNNNITVRQGSNTTDTGKNEIDLRLTGGYNTLNINQSVTTTGASTNSTNNNYQYVDVFGSNNTLTTQQNNVGGVGGHYMETTIVGNTNNVTASQTNNGNKMMFDVINGNSNTVNATQSGTGQHYLDLSLTGNGNSASVLQDGPQGHKATINLTNAGGPSSVSVSQTSTTAQTYSITQTCVQLGGCATVTVSQGQ